MRNPRSRSAKLRVAEKLETVDREQAKTSKYKSKTK
jgi:hypothetical protein